MYFNLFVRPDDARMELYRLQRDIGHELGLKMTFFISPGQFGKKELMDICRADHERYGDELGIWLSADGESGDPHIWLVREEDKARSIRKAVDAFIRCFGYPPEVVGNYVMDAAAIRLVKEYCPGVKACVAGCFEEGVKVFHGCNNSWYLFSEGMSWNPWYPSKGHSLRPAVDEEDWAGVVAVPHLSRDLVLSYESRNDFFASHPANVQRGLANDGLVHEYDYNLCDQYRMQEDYNDGFSYYQIHVSAGWLSRNPNILDPDEITQRLYRETLEYIARLRDEGQIQDMTLGEFADAYRVRVSLGRQTVGVGKDILTGSGKHYCWIFDTDYRVLVDAFQGGSIGDLRPYIGRYDAVTGPDAPCGRYYMNTYPYLIQSQYRTGAKTHSRDGSRTTLLLSRGGEKKDLCAFATRIRKVERIDEGSILTLEPVEVAFSDGAAVELQTVYEFLPEGRIGIIRKIRSLGGTVEIGLQEYVKASYGFTEYPEEMQGISLKIDGEKVLDYTYRGKNCKKEGGRTASAVIPAVGTEIALQAQSAADSVCAAEGNLFSPFYTLTLDYTVTAEETKTKEVRSWLLLKKAQG